MNDYPNITALADGRVNGRVSEYILLKPEARDLLAELARLTSALEAAERGLRRSQSSLMDAHGFIRVTFHIRDHAGECQCNSCSMLQDLKEASDYARKCLAEIKGSK